MEVSIALLLGSIITLGTVQLAQAISGSARLQQNLSAIQNNAGFALQSMGAEITQAGYHPRPWENSALDPFQESVDNASEWGDRLAVRRWSDHNCYGNPNPERDSFGQPLFFLRTSMFEVSSQSQLVLTCHYGPDETSLVRQVNRMGLIEHVYRMHALFAVDSTGDRNADRWATFGDWSADATVLGVRIGLLLLSPEPYETNDDLLVSLLNEPGIPVPDNRLVRVFETSWTLLGQVQS